MEQRDEKFLRTLHFRMFESSKLEGVLRKNNDFSNDVEAHRNDQRITECMARQKMLDEIVEDFMRHANH